ncbi:histidine phosphatase family protein [Methylocapsa sp. S129]|uniref:histidine phosphatase family protein n=1 Tax=Methylocapsa sp. S129 TaxID=1641869 RepID=UPI00131BCF56|nr:histidine phosphatase family protein [Methylocapsa sp. S129]
MPAPTHLRLLCHAATSAVRTSAFSADEPIDSQGRRKLAALPFRLGHADRTWTSPALRARQTAQGLGLVASVEPMLRDCDYGRWAGRAFDEVAAQEPDAIAEWLRDPASAPHGGESTLSLIERVAAWLDAQNAPGRIVAITHASVIRAAIVHAIEAPPRSFWRIDVAPLSLTRLSGANGRWNLASIGRTEEQQGPDADDIEA